MVFALAPKYGTAAQATKPANQGPPRNLAPELNLIRIGRSYPLRNRSDADEPQSLGRGNDWVKKTCAQRETLPIAGFALKDNKFDGVYIGRLKGNDLVYAGKVDHGFDTASANDLQARLKPLIRKTQPYAKKIPHKAIWVEPSLLAEIEYRAKSAEGKMRHPFFKGLREDL